MSNLSATTIMHITLVIVALLAVFALLVHRSTPRQTPAKRTVSRPAVPAVDVWSPVPYEPEAFKRQLTAEQIKPPARPVWRGHSEVAPAEQAAIAARVEDTMENLQRRRPAVVVKEEQVSHSEFAQLFPQTAF